jgi:hypothetical protein
MSIVRVHKRKEDRRWSVLDNAPVENPLISWDAKAVLWYLLTKPDDWTARNEDIVSHGTLGKDGVIAVLKELETFGYAHRWERRGEGGLFEYGTEIYEDAALNPHFDPATAPTAPVRTRSKKKKPKADGDGSTDPATEEKPANAPDAAPPAPVEPTRTTAERAAEIARLALAQTDDSLTTFGAIGAALLRLQKEPFHSDAEIAADIARHYRPAGAVEASREIQPEGDDRHGQTVTVKPTLPNTDLPNTKKKEESSNEDSLSAKAEEIAGKVAGAAADVESARRFIESQKQLMKATAELSGRNRRPVALPTEAEWKEVCGVFSAWKEIRRKNANARLTPERARAVLDRLRSPAGFTSEDIRNGIRGVHYSAHHSGQNEKGEVYDDLELICRTDQHLERFIGYFERATGPKEKGGGNGRFEQNSGARGESDRERNLRESSEVFGWNDLPR